MKYIIDLQKFMPETNPIDRLKAITKSHGVIDIGRSQGFGELKLHLYLDHIIAPPDDIITIRFEIPDDYQWALPYPEELKPEILDAPHDEDWYPTTSFSTKYGEACSEFCRYRMHQLCDWIEAELASGKTLFPTGGVSSVFPELRCSFSKYKELTAVEQENQPVTPKTDTDMEEIPF